MPHVTAATSQPDAVPTGNTTHTRPENRLYFPALDGLRTLAVSLVFLQHYFHMPWGYTGVGLFFVLSGFLITGILYDTRDQPDRARSFYIRRTLRIFPLYYAVFLALALLTPVIHPQWTRWWLAWPFYLGNLLRLAPLSPDVDLAANAWLGFGPHAHHVLFLGHFWSLCLEEQFYLVWPWVVFAAYTWRRLAWICLSVVVVSPLLRMMLAAAPHHPTSALVLYTFTPLRLDSLLMGGLLALLIRSSYRDRVLLIARRFLYLAALVVVPAFLHALHFRRWNEYPYQDGRLTWGESLLSLMFTALIAAALSPGSLVFRLFRLRPLRANGRITYGIYVFHDIPHPLYAAVTNHFAAHSRLVAAHRGLVTAAIAIPCTLTLAWLSFRFFETPFLDLKERWAPSHRIAASTLPLAVSTVPGS